MKLSIIILLLITPLTTYSNQERYLKVIKLTCENIQDIIAQSSPEWGLRYLLDSKQSVDGFVRSSNNKGQDISEHPIVKNCHEKIELLKKEIESDILLAEQAKKAKQLADAEKKKKEKELAKAKNNELLAQKRVQDQIKLEQEEEVRQEYHDYAVKHGYDGVSFGLLNTIFLLERGQTSMSLEKKYLQFKMPIDMFRFQGVVDNYVIFEDAGRKIALVKSNDQIYGPASRLPTGFYSILGLQSFTTVLGAQEDLLVFDQFSRLNN